MTNQEKRKHKRALRIRRRKFSAMALAIYFFLITIWPTQSFALTGGPSQPEVQSFEPIGTSDMVDLFSGDFVYNIPLLDVEGYPINLAYHSGVSMDQEASWVGLGWNVNVGSVNRAMRGIPDDFNGDVITKEFHRKKNETYGVTFGADLEIFGLSPSKESHTTSTTNSSLGIGANMGITYNNYNGYNASLGLNVSGGIGHVSAGLGLNSSSDGGLSIQPSLSFNLKSMDDKKAKNKLGVKIGSSFNSRIGLQELSISGTVSRSEFSRASKRDGKAAKVGARNDMAGASFDLMQPTYSPIIGDQTKTHTIKARFKSGLGLFGFDGGWSIDGFYSSQQLAENIQHKKAYGYMHTESGQQTTDVMLDINRENDGSYTAQTPALPLTNYTYDMYSVTGQGNGGSYRPFRSDISYVFDPDAKTNSTSGSVGVETSPGGNSFHVGVDLGVVVANSKSGKWSEQNDAMSSNHYHSTTYNRDYESFYMKEANEKSVSSDDSFYADAGKEDAVSFKLNEVSKFNTRLSNTLESDHGFSTSYGASKNTRKNRERRNSNMTFLSNRELSNGLGLNDEFVTNTAKPQHHIGEITTLGPDGSRYVYGLAAYNNTKQEYSFALGTDHDNDLDLSYMDANRCADGLVNYVASDRSVNNDKGKDNYYDATTTPGYAHSHMLTGIISPDYIDVDGVKGPSAGDMGTWTTFKYDRPSDVKYDPLGAQADQYRWRTPYKENKAQYNEGLKSVATDDKANFSYGTKELWYLDQIETKNFIAVFEKELRDDACGVKGIDGGIDENNNMLKLKSITLYARPDFEANGLAGATPIKTVHFEYDYSLCPGVPNNKVAGQGKLTLKRVFFTYRGSQEGKLSPYDFTYADVDQDGTQDANFAYNLKGYDRWGNFKPNANSTCDLSDPLSTSEFSYVQQEDKDLQALRDAAWSLTSVDLPSGGKIKVNFESDDYSHVQHKQAMQMAKIVGVSNDAPDEGINKGLTADLFDFDPVSLSDLANENRYVFIELPEGTTDPLPYFRDIKDLYFRVLTEFKNDGVEVYDYVSGYCEFENSITMITEGTTPIAKVKLKAVSFKDGGSEDYNPITAAGVQFGRLHLSPLVWDDAAADGTPINASTNGMVDVLDAMANAFASFKSGFQNPNVSRWKKEQGTKIVLNKSWVRLNNVNGHKLGGGCRVKSLNMSDEWSTMVSNGNGDSFDYGQEYEYLDENGTSSGVASYEPQIGGDENPWKQPVTYASVKRWAPDDRFYSETPFGESFFPSASVGYGRVIVKNLQRGVDDNADDKISDDERTVRKHATGEVQHEFYTCKDFPTIVHRTEMTEGEDFIRHKTNPFGILSLLNIKSKDHMTASQGFAIECNDMHGKPKAQRVYQEDKTEPITSVEYYYQSDPYLTSSQRLNNEAVAVNSDGSVNNTATIGVFFDMIADFRQQTSSTVSPTLSLNTDAFFLGPVFIPAFVPIPGISVDKTQFRSSSVTKVIQKFGVLERTVAKDLGSVVETKNLAYDTETGEVLLTETTTDFNDKIYSMNYPAYWHYDKMGLAYKNLGFETGVTAFVAGIGTIPDAEDYYVEGDELEVTDFTTGFVEKGWVTGVFGNSIEVQLFDGSLIAGAKSLKTLRSGRRNQQMQSMASLTTRNNPLTSLQNNIYENVIQASAIEFSDGWRSYCDCYDDGSGTLTSTNPYVLGTKGNFRPKTSYLHLSDRTQDSYNDNTNIREDGYFTSYTPFYKFNGSDWAIDREDWTFTAEVTEFNPLGQELENQDALGRYSAATFGFNQTLATSVAANSRYHEIGFDSFEDYPFSPCADEHFKVDEAFRTTSITDETAHTGFHSLKVSSGSPVTIGRALDWCDDTPPCSDLGIDITGNSEFYDAKPKGGLPAYAVSYNVVSGTPGITYDPFTMNLHFALAGGSSGNQNFVVQVIVTDSQGCEFKQLITVVNGIIQ